MLLENQLEMIIKNKKTENEEALILFDHVVMNMSVEEIKNSKQILDQGNEIFFDHSRKFWQYNEQALNRRALNRFEEINIKFPYVNYMESYCDVGCGNGEMLLAAMNLGCKYSVGIDVNPGWAGVDLKEMTKSYSKRLYIHKLDLVKEQFGEKFDFVTSYSSFEHFKDPLIMLEKICDLVKPSGYLYIHFGGIWQSADGHHQYRHIQFPYYHLIFNEKVIKEYHSEKGINDFLYYNKWSAYDFLFLFLRQPQMKVIHFEPLYCFRDYYFVDRFPTLFTGYGFENLVISGFDILYQRVE